jgi:hypothetical protein
VGDLLDFSYLTDFQRNPSHFKFNRFELILALVAIRALNYCRWSFLIGYSTLWWSFKELAKLLTSN